MARESWLDNKTQSPLIEQKVQNLTTFMEAMADGVITDKELAEQEKRLVAALQEVEPLLNDEQHGKVTRLLCELTAYDLMQALNGMQAARPPVRFRG
jgi:hypothetical protein